MTPPPTVARRALAGASLAVVLVPLTACSQGGGGFCDSGEQVLTEVDAAGALSGDPEAFAEAISDVRDGFESVEAPEEVADDWAAFTRVFTDLDDVLQQVDLSDQEAFQAAVTQFVESAESDELSDAGDGLTSYFTEHCQG